MDWAQILVIILAIFLGVFLILGIVLVVMFIKVTQQIRMVVGTAERTMKIFERVLSQARGFASPLVIMKIVAKYIKKRQKKGGNHVDEK